MTFITGAAPSANVEGFSGWGNYTFVDPSVAIPVGSVVTHLGVHAPVGGTHRLRLGRELGGGQYDCPAAAKVDLAHTVAGYQDAALASPFTVPAGTWRFVCSVLAGSTTRSVTGGSCTPSVVGDGTVTINTSLPAVPPMRATIGEGGDPPPPPPPPPPGGFNLAIVGQSNAENLASQAGGVLSARYQAVTGQAVTVINLAHDSSPVAFWGPGTPFLAELVATPMDVLVYLSGEYEAGTTVADAHGYGEAMKGVINAVRDARGQIPVFVVELFTNPRPYLSLIRDSQRLLCDPRSRYGLHDVTLVPCRLIGTIDAGIHLDQTRLESLAKDIADAVARRMFPDAEVMR
jgi:hypothetical protein